MSRATIYPELKNAKLEDTTEVNMMPLGGVAVLSTAKKWLWNYGTTVPADAVAGYSPGAWYQHTDASGGVDAFYVNVGTLASCNFDAVITEVITETLTSQTGDAPLLDMTQTNDTTYLSGTDMGYAAGRGATILEITGTWSATSGGYHGLYVALTSTGAVDTATAGVIPIKTYAQNTAAMTDGNIWGAMFVAQHNHATNAMENAAALIGFESYAHVAAAGTAGTVLGGISGYHNECSGTKPTGSVYRGFQVVCDDAGSNDVADEATGLCIWNMAGAQTNAINVVNSGTGFTNFVLFNDDSAPAVSTSSAVGAIGTAGFITIKIGTATRYIGLSSTMTA